MIVRSLHTVSRVLHGLARRTEALSSRLASRAEPEAVIPSHPENARFKDIHRGQRAFIIGNGPSLASQDLAPLKGEILFTMNAFDRHPLALDLQPTYHFMADPVVNSGNEGTEDMLTKVRAGLPSSTFFVVAWDDIQSQQLTELKSESRLWQVPTKGLLFDDSIGPLDMTVGLPEVTSTSQLAIMTAAYMGCSPIYLLGLDSDWAASTNLDRHFYNESTVDRERYERARPALSYQSILECTLMLWKGYAALRTYLESEGIEVINCTAGGLLDVFPRKRLEDVLAEPQI